MEYQEEEVRRARMDLWVALAVVAGVCTAGTLWYLWGAATHYQSHWNVEVGIGSLLMGAGIAAVLINEARRIELEPTLIAAGESTGLDRVLRGIGMALTGLGVATCWLIIGFFWLFAIALKYMLIALGVILFTSR